MNKLKDLLKHGIEKIIINKVIFDDQNFIEKYHQNMENNL